MTDSQERPAAPRVDLRRERVAFETDYHRIEGWLVLPKEGYRSRLSDFLNRGDLDFIPLVNAEIAPLNGTTPGGTGVRSFITVARTHVQLAYPFEEGS